MPRIRLARAVATIATVFAVTLGVAVVAMPTAQAAVPLRIMTLGDSITGGPGCWRALLWDRLQRTGFTNIDFVGTLAGGGCNLANWDGDNEGHGGFLATGIANQNQLPGWLAATRPDIVVMHLGTNDVWNNIPAATILAAYSTLVDQMRASNPAMKILVAKIIPMTPSGCTTCPTGVTALNGAIPGWAASKTTAASPITVVDQFTGFDTVADTIGDGVHPDDSGFQKMSDRWYPALTPLLGGTVDTSPPTVPGGLAVMVRCNPVVVTLTWTASTDNVGVSGYDVERATNGGAFTPIATTAATTYAEPINGLSQYRVRARDAAGNASAFTAPVSALPPPCPAPDTLPPTIPGTPTASLTCGFVTLTWPPSSDNIGVAAYEIWRAPGTSGGTFTLAASTTTTSITLATTGTFRYQIRARDGAGNVSPFTAPIVVVPTACPNGGTCAATLTLQTGWGNGYVMQPNRVTNTGTSPLTGWTVTFTLPVGHGIVGAWNATVTVSGQTVTARGIAGQNATLGVGASTTWGFQASRPDGNTAVPSATTCASP
jgi:lysophospholipase L1-like esterase